ncbi:MAG: hypothetical protein JXB45_06150 [Candidatus Krumholzibacteriota bacterium]|nr:hypothetical protein [Candidatus Krumholzibacteriota bacterium]
MRIRFILIPAVLIMIFPGTVFARIFPVGLEARGGIGAAYCSMSELNQHLAAIRGNVGANMAELDNGYNFSLEGRIWFWDRFAALLGYEHYWFETSQELLTHKASFRAPADVYLLGVALRALSIPEICDLNVGARGSFAHSLFASNEVYEPRMDEYKENEYGWDVFAELTANFFRPLEVGVQLGYRGLKVTGYRDKLNQPCLFSSSGKAAEIDYSGVFLYFTAGFGLW